MLPVVTVLNCESDIDQDSYDLVELVRRFDVLFELCETRRLSGEEQHELNDLFGYLQLKEEEFWGDVDPFLIFMIGDQMGLELPALRYQLGLLADN